MSTLTGANLNSNCTALNSNNIPILNNPNLLSQTSNVVVNPPQLLNQTLNSNSNQITNTSSTSSSSSTNNPTNSKQLLNNSTIKLVQRLLDEASQTGDLLLSNKNLNEFPSKLAINYDLSDTLNADLSKNHLTEFPKEVCVFDSLEKLSLYSNLIRTIPDISIYQLKCLKYLDLNSNNLSYIPPCLCNLTSLEVLTINNNKLVSLPEEIGRLDKLIQLDVSCNEITHLPVQIGDMSSLRALNVRRNFLVELPKEISQLKLVSFDCSSNRLSKLPLCFREMVTIIDLVVDHNPLEVPPAHICTKGLLHIMKYLLVEAIKEEKKRGILTEYEINTQYNNFNYNLSAHNQRLSCTAGLGYMYQNSLRNMSKKLGSSSVPSSSMSTVSTSSSTSSSSIVSSSSLTSQVPSNNIYSNKQVKSSFNDLPPPHPPPPPPQTSQQINQSSTNTTPTNQQFYNPNSILNLNNNFKNEIENADYMEAPSTSSPSSTKSSSSNSSVSSNGLTLPLKSTIKTQKIQESPNSKIVSINELISIKSPLSNTIMYQQVQQQQQLNNNNNISYSKFNNRNLDDDQEQQKQQQQQNIWSHQQNMNINNSKFKTNTHCGLGQLNNNNNINSNNNNSANYNTNSNNLKRFTSNDCYETFNKNLHLDATSNFLNNPHTKSNIDKRYSQPSVSTNTLKQQTVTKVFVSNDSIDDSAKTNSSLSSSTSSNQLLHDDNVNQINFNSQTQIISQSDQFINEYIIPITHESTQDKLNDEYGKFYTSTSNNSQQIWVPREDINSSFKEPENQNPAFTIKRHFIQIQEEQKQIDILKKTIESKLKIQLPTCIDELGVSLSDGVVLCHLINQIFPRAVQIIHVPSLAVPKLSLAKCRKNVENFIDACRRLGLPENDLCCAHDIIEAKNTAKVARTVILLVGYNQYLQQQENINNSYSRQGTFTSLVGGHNSNVLQTQQTQQQTAV